MADFSLSQQHRLLKIVGELERDADVLILDTAAGVGRSVTSLVEAADMGIVITTPEPTAIAARRSTTRASTSPGVDAPRAARGAASF